MNSAKGTKLQLPIAAKSKTSCTPEIMGDNSYWLYWIFAVCLLLRILQGLMTTFTTNLKQAERVSEWERERERCMLLTSFNISLHKNAYCVANFDSAIAWKQKKGPPCFILLKHHPKRNALSKIHFEMNFLLRNCFPRNTTKTNWKRDLQLASFCCTLSKTENFTRNKLSNEH